MNNCIIIEFQSGLNFFGLVASIRSLWIASSREHQMRIF